MPSSYTVPYANQGQTFAPNFSIVQLLRDAGSDQAQFALQHGAIDANLWNTLGRIPGQAVQTYQEVQKSQLGNQAIESNAIDLKQKQQDADDRATMNRIYQAAYGLDPSQQPGFVGPTQRGLPQAGDTPPGFETDANGAILPTTAFLTKAYAAAGLGVHIPAMVAANAKTAEALATLKETKGKVAIQTTNALGVLGAQAAEAIKHGVPPVQAFHFAALTAITNEAITPTQLKPYLDAVATDPTQISMILDALQQAPEQQKLASEKMTAEARKQTADTGDFSPAGIVKQKVREQQLRQQGPVQPLPGALPTPGGPTGLNPDTEQPMLREDAITGGSVNPIAPQLSPAAGPMLQGLPPGTPEAPVPPPLSAADLALAAHQQLAVPKNLQRAQVLLDGKPAEVLMNPADGTFKDLNGQAIANAADRIKPMPPAAIQVNNAITAANANAPPVSATRPTGPEANKVNPRTGLTPNGLYQASIANALQGTMPAIGLGQSPQAMAVRDGVINTAGALAAQAGVDLPTLRAEYKANAGTLSRLLPQATATANANNTMADNLDLALAKSDEVARSGSKLVNRYLQWAQGELTPAKGLAEFETYVYTAAREYAKVTSGGAASSQGLTDSAAREASKLLNVAQSPDAFAGVVQAMKRDAGNVVSEQTKGLGRVSSTIANFFSVANGGTVGGGTAAPGGGVRVLSITPVK